MIISNVTLINGLPYYGSRPLPVPSGPYLVAVSDGGYCAIITEQPISFSTEPVLALQYSAVYFQSDYVRD